MLHEANKRDFAHRLERVSILVADSDKQIATIVRDVLKGFGFKKVFVAPDGAEALRVMKTQPIDLAISEWNLDQVDGISMLKYIRAANEIGFRYKPVIMLTARSEEADVLAARDAGVNEYVIKPFTARNLVDRIRLVIDYPKNFVWAPSFKGPDRRIKATGRIDGDRRGLPPKIIHKDVSGYAGGEGVQMVQADYALKEKIGMDVKLDQIFTPERIGQAQEAIAQGADQFLVWFAEDIKKLQQCFRFLHEGVDVRAMLRDIQASAFSIKARAGTFGYDCASLVSNSLYQFVRKHPAECNSAHSMVISKHIESLSTILQHNINGLGGAVGQELLQKLKQLTQKYP